MKTFSCNDFESFYLQLQAQGFLCMMHILYLICYLWSFNKITIFTFWGVDPRFQFLSRVDLKKEGLKSYPLFEVGDQKGGV